MIDQQIVSTQEGLWHLQTLLSELPPGQTFNRLGLESRVQQIIAVMEWSSNCKTRLNLER